MTLTHEEVAREVNAHVEWGASPAEIRLKLAKMGATPMAVDAALRDALSRADSSARVSGFFGSMIGLCSLAAGAWLGRVWWRHEHALLTAPSALERFLIATVPDRVVVAIVLGALVVGAWKSMSGLMQMIAGRVR